MLLGKYRHYKGRDYEVLGIGKHTETLEEFVVYKALYTTDDFPYGQIWLRPKEMFLGNVKVDGDVVKRFRYIGK